MYWVDKEKPEEYKIPENVIDLSFKIDCKQLKLDHAWALSEAISEILPWFEQEPQAAIHHIYISQSGNGWCRTDEGENDLIQLSRRTRLKIRVPVSRKTDTEELTGKTISVDGHELSFGQSDSQLLSTLTTIVSRHVHIPETDQDEELFLHKVNAELQHMGIKARKMLCGKKHQLKAHNGPITTRSLMLADLSPEDSIQLQENGLGLYYSYGCGVFIPQKGITAVNNND